MKNRFIEQATNATYRENTGRLRFSLPLALKLLSITLLLSSWGCDGGTNLETVPWGIITAVHLDGPATITKGTAPNGKDYTVSFKIARLKPGGAKMMVSLYREPVSVYAGNALLSFQELTLPDPQDSVNVTLHLGCPGDSIVGTANTEPDGSPNHEGLPPGPDSHVGGTDLLGNPLAGQIHATVTGGSANTFVTSNTIPVLCRKP
jgi:hypothetical protein